MSLSLKQNEYKYLVQKPEHIFFKVLIWSEGEIQIEKNIVDFKVNKTHLNNLLHLAKHTFSANQKTMPCQIQYALKKQNRFSPMVEIELVCSDK